MMRDEIEREVLGSTRPLTRMEFHQIVELGVFQDERVELMYGQIVKMMPTGTTHDTTVVRLNKALILALGDRAVVRPQCSFAASDESEPVPDFVVTEEGDHEADHPSGALLVIEVARSSLRYDRRLKAHLYANSDVREYWIVNLIEECVEVHRNASAGRWQDRVTYRRGERVAMLAFPDVNLEIDALLPRVQGT